MITKPTRWAPTIVINGVTVFHPYKMAFKINGFHWAEISPRKKTAPTYNCLGGCAYFSRWQKTTTFSLVKNGKKGDPKILSHLAGGKMVMTPMVESVKNHLKKNKSM